MARSPEMSDLEIPDDIELNVAPDGTVTVWESFGDQLRVTQMVVTR